MKPVIIESPFKGDRERNLSYARDLLRFCLERGEAPFASHLLYTQCLDDDLPKQRALGIQAGLVWGEKASKSVVGVDLGVSQGMRLGIEHALDLERPVEFVSLLEWRGFWPKGQEPSVRPLTLQTREGIEVWR